MASLISSPPPSSRQVAGLYVALERLWKDRRILDIGSYSVEGLAHMAQRGAHQILAFSDNPTALKKAIGSEEPTLEFLHEQDPPFSCETDFFEAVICLDLQSRLSNSSDAQEWISEIRRILKPEGILIVSSSQSSYQQLHNQIQPHFISVTLLGQFALDGQLFKDFGSSEEEPGLLLNRTLLASDEDPQNLVMVFGPHCLEMDDLVLIQLPTGNEATKETPALAQLIKRQEKELSLLASRLAAQELQNAQLLARHNAEILRLRGEIDSLRSLSQSVPNHEQALITQQLDLHEKKHQAELDALQKRYQTSLQQADRELAAMRQNLENATTSHSSPNPPQRLPDADIMATATYGMVDTPEVSPFSGASLETSFGTPLPIPSSDETDE